MRFKPFNWIKQFLSSEWIAPFSLFIIPATIFSVLTMQDIQDNRALSRKGVYVIARIIARGKARKGLPYAKVVYAYGTREYTTKVTTEYYSGIKTGDYLYLRILPYEPETTQLAESARVPECMVALAKHGQSWKELPSCNTSSTQDQVIFSLEHEDQPFIKEILRDSSKQTPEYITTHNLSGQLITMRGEKVVAIRSFVKGRTWGEELQSFEDGSIHHYVLRSDSVNATFFRTYTPAGKIWYEEGTPIIHREVRSFKDGKVDIKLVVADHIFRDMEISCFVEGEKYTKTELADDSAYWPYRVCHFTINVSRKYDHELILEVYGKDKYTGDGAIFKDTLKLARRG